MEPQYIAILVAVVIVLFLFIKRENTENFGVSPGFDPSVRASIAGIGPIDPDCAACQ